MWVLRFQIIHLRILRPWIASRSAHRIASLSHNVSIIEIQTAGAFSDSMHSAMRNLGVTESTLSPSERETLDEQGFLILRDMMTPEELSLFRHVHERLMQIKYADEPLPSANIVKPGIHHEPGTRRLADLVSEHDVYDRTYSHPRLLAAMAHAFQRDYKLNSINARDALPGHGGQPFHRDGGHPHTICNTVNSTWLLDDFTSENGATRMIPGSHRHRDLPPDPMATDPREVLVTAPAGSVVVFRGDVLHAGTINRSTAIRRAFHVFFTHRQYERGDYDQRKRIRKATWERISPAARWILNV